ncbi:MAG TPA: type I methionyl aminopeptidase [Desulfuromonadaceae bacterium]
MIILKSLREIERMRASCRIVAEILALLGEQVRPGVSTLDLENIALEESKKRKAKPAFKGYHNFPYALCCSLNNQVVHGMPSSVPLKNGDLLSIDFGVLYDDFYGDAAITLPVGDVAEQALRLTKVTERSLYEGIAQATPDARLFDISFAIQSYVESNGFSVVRDFVGHGIGKSLHEDPQVPNFGDKGKGVKLKPGMVLAIEPMINQKSHEVRVLEDGWTVITCDGGLSAHFEHTVAITDSGPEILTSIVV